MTEVFFVMIQKLDVESLFLSFTSQWSIAMENVSKIINFSMEKIINANIGITVRDPHNISSNIKPKQCESSHEMSAVFNRN